MKSLKKVNFRKCSNDRLAETIHIRLLLLYCRSITLSAPDLKPYDMSLLTLSRDTTFKVSHFILSVVGPWWRRFSKWKFLYDLVGTLRKLVFSDNSRRRRYIRVWPKLSRGKTGRRGAPAKSVLIRIFLTFLVSMLPSLTCISHLDEKKDVLCYVLGCRKCKKWPNGMKKDSPKMAAGHP